MNMLILTEADAEALCGPKDADGKYFVETSPGHALQPAELTDGTFALPEAVLTDPAHTSVYAQLDGFPVSDVPPEAMKGYGGVKI